VQYNPKQRFCSYVGNKDYKPNGEDCKKDANDNSCKKYISTALPFCGTGTASTNRYNEGIWNWEFCVGKTTGTSGSGENIISYSVLRCGEGQVPDWQTGTGGIYFETCRCVEDPYAQKYSNRNACYCPNQGTVKYEMAAFGNGTSSGYTAVEIGQNGALGDTKTIANGYPNVSDLGLSTVSAYDNINFKFYGGECAVAPYCNSSYPEECKTQDDCLSVKDANNKSIFVWDTRVSTCLSNPDKCSPGFGGKKGSTCFTSEQPCGYNNLAACTEKLSCNTYGGVWDMYVLKNQCVEDVNYCNSGAYLSGSTTECAASRLTTNCTAAYPLHPDGTSSCIVRSACTTFGGTLASSTATSCECTGTNDTWDPLVSKKCIATCPADYEVSGATKKIYTAAASGAVPKICTQCALTATSGTTLSKAQCAQCGGWGYGASGGYGTKCYVSKSDCEGSGQEGDGQTCAQPN